MAERNGREWDHGGIPEIVARELGQSFTPKGVEQAWTARWRTLGERRLCDVWDAEPQAVLDAIEAMNAGDYV